MGRGMSWCWSSRCGVIAFAAALPLYQLTHDFGRDLGWTDVNVDSDRVLVPRGLLQRRKLTVEQGDRHEVLVPRGHTTPDEVVRSFEVDQRYV